MSDHDPNASFRALYEREFDYVYRTLRRLGVRAADLEDVAQEVFLRVYQRYSEAQLSAESIRPWLFSFAVRVAANYRRLVRHGYEVFDERRLDRASEGLDPEQRAMQLDRRELVLEALATLGFERRAVFVAHDIDHYSAPQIATALGIPLNTVYSRLRLARADFKGAVQRIHREGGPR